MHVCMCAHVRLGWAGLGWAGRSGLVRSGLVWSGLVWSGLVWSGLVWMLGEPIEDQAVHVLQPCNCELGPLPAPPLSSAG